MSPVSLPEPKDGLSTGGAGSGGRGSGGNGPGDGPQRRREPALNIPPLLSVLVVALTGVHMLVTYGPQALGAEIFINLAMFPARFLASPETLGDYFYGPSWLRYATPVSYGLLHADWLHLGVNALWLVTFGSPVVRRLGGGRFMVLLIAGTVAGGLAHLVIFWGSVAPLIGASAGISAIMGGAVRFVFDPRDRGMFLAVRHPVLAAERPLQPLRDLWSNPSVLVFCGMLIVTNLLFGAVSVPGVGEGSSIAWQAHLAGFALGFFAFPLIDRGRAP